MSKRIKVLDLDLNQPIDDISGLNDYAGIRALLRWNTEPVGYVELPLVHGTCSASAIHAAILSRHDHVLQKTMIRRDLEQAFTIDTQNQNKRVDNGSINENMLVTVAVCTRDRADQLKDCLESIRNIRYRNIEVLVVDNAPATDATRALVQTEFPEFRYVLEPRPGLDWARNRAIIEASGEVLAYTDDDVVVDPVWVDGLVRVFQADPTVMAVTGLVAPYEMDTGAQVLFERYGGFGRGFTRTWYHRDFVGTEDKSFAIGAGQFGTGANMAYRRSVFDQIGQFDPALDVGTVTNGGGDLEMFFRVLEEGYTLVYEPAALVWHRHRKTMPELKVQFTNHGVGLYSLFLRSARFYPHRRWHIARFGLWWFWYWSIRRLLKSFISRPIVPRNMIIAELRGALIGLTRYPKARRRAEQIRAEFPDEPATGEVSAAEPGRPLELMRAGTKGQEKIPVAIRCVDVSRELHAINDITEYESCRAYVFYDDRLLGFVDIRNARMQVSTMRLRDAIAEKLYFELCGLRFGDRPWQPELELLEKRLDINVDRRPPPAPSSISVSIALATYDRPDQLRECLEALTRLQSPRRIEIIVIDNHPASGQTPPVVRDFPEVILVTEPRQGLAYARNAGFIHATGDIVIATDDDVVMPTDWVEQMVAPFERSDIGIVTGNVLPRELETEFQYQFEEYGGLGRGFKRAEFGPGWFRASRRRAAPTWQLGATANAAFRAEVFRDPKIGLMDEALGPGMPSGVGEDTYLFYKIIKAGYTLVYQPDALVWHTHRRDRQSLRKQIYNYSKGHVAYHLTTLLRDRDRRAVFRLLVELPRSYLKRIYWRLRGHSDYPISLILLEIGGNLAGPYTLWLSRRRVKREGRSEFPVPTDISENSIE